MSKHNLKVLVVGTGSAGIRHIKNLISLGVEVSAYRYRPELINELSKQFKINVFKSLDEALSSPQDAVVIANRIDQHMPVALAAAKNKLHLYIEKPLSNNLNESESLLEITKSENVIVEIGCMMRFHPNLQIIQKLLMEETIGIPYAVQSCVGQYLPDWHPGQDYTQSYSSKKEHGGGVLLDLIHELDYLYWWFGAVSDTTAFLDHISALEIETEDIAQILLRFEKGAVAQVQMDYLSPFYRRSCEIIGSKGIINWDFNSGEVILRVKEKSKPIVFTLPPEFKRNNMFHNHMSHFLKRVHNRDKPAVSLEDGINVLKIALAAYKSSKNRCAVRPSEIHG